MSLYDVLGVKPDADGETIRRAHRRLAENQRAQGAVNEEIGNIERAQAYAKDYGYAFDPAPPASAFMQSHTGRDDGWVRNMWNHP